MKITTNLVVRICPMAGHTLHPSLLASLALLWRRVVAQLIAPALFTSILLQALNVRALPLPVAAAAGGPTLAMRAIPGSVLLAQVNPREAIKSFLEFLSYILILLATCLVSYGSILIAQGRHLDGVVAIVAGFILVLAVPLIYLFAKYAGTQI
jgi:hypothetical protein